MYRPFKMAAQRVKAWVIPLVFYCGKGGGAGFVAARGDAHELVTRQVKGNAKQVQSQMAGKADVWANAGVCDEMMRRDAAASRNKTQT